MGFEIINASEIGLSSTGFEYIYLSDIQSQPSTSAMLEQVKMLLSIIDDSKNDLLSFYIEQAVIMALEYCNVDKIDIKYINTISSLAVYLYSNASELGFKEKSEGEVAIKYEVVGIPTSIKKSLPKPKIGVI